MEEVKGSGSKNSGRTGSRIAKDARIEIEIEGIRTRGS
jgi:hypothetical protein